MRRTFATVNLSKLIRNYLKIRNFVTPAKVMAVIKADGYGHGAVKVAQTLNSLGAQKPDYYAVSIFEEALELRSNGITEPILLLEPATEQLIKEARKLDITISVCAPEQLPLLKKLHDLPELAGLKIHLKIDTGMNRLGLRWDEAFPAINSLVALDRFNWEGIYTHFATADDTDLSFARTQLERFTSIIDRAKAQGIVFKEVHASNSSAVFQVPDSHFTMIRPGLLLYGYYPSSVIPEKIKLEPILHVYSEIETVKVMKKGESLGYGLTYTATEDITIATLPIGYADGYYRLLSDRAKVIINGKIYPQIGRVSMDRIMINLLHDPIQPGTRVLLLGVEQNVKFDARDWAELCYTIPYEVICLLSKRLPRTYVTDEQGREVA